LQFVYSHIFVLNGIFTDLILIMNVVMCQRKMLQLQFNCENLSTYIAFVINTCDFSHAIVYTITLSAIKCYFVKSIRNIFSTLLSRSLRFRSRMKTSTVYMVRRNGPGVVVIKSLAILKRSAPQMRHRERENREYSRDGRVLSVKRE